MNVRFLAAACAVVLLGTGCAHTHAPLPTVLAVDLDRYAGTWYEIARLPNPFQDQCVSDTRATYARDKDRITVLNECRVASGRFDSAQGIARVVEGSGNAKLRVSFFRPFYGDYWVLALDPDYRWVLVGEPGRKYAWILARSPQLDAATRDALLARAGELGFDRRTFITTPHTQP
ncbi:MAG: lipocalin family protein [Thiobacillus sp.]